MKLIGIRSITVKKWRPSQKNEGPIEARKNLLNRNFSTTDLNQKWVTDITYIHTVKDGWCYLSSIQDLHSKKIIAWSFGKKMTTGLVLNTLNQAVQTQHISENLILHSDLGSQYTSQKYQEQMDKLGIQHSFSNKGCPYDNAGIESFHATLKKEEVYQKQDQTFEQARLSLFQYIESFYNRYRIHSSIGYLTPQEMEALCQQAA